MLDTLLRWWATEMLGWVPAGIVRPRTDGAVATLGADGSLPMVNRRGTARQPVVLRVPAAAMLEREVPLPLAAERDPDAVLGFEMDRLTPFAAADVHWGWAVLRRDRAAGRVVLRLLLVPKVAVAAALAALAADGLVPVAIEAEGAGARRIALRDTGGGPRRGRWALFGLGAACAVAAAVAVALPFVLQGVRLADTEARIAVLRPRVDQVDAIRRRALAGGADRDAVVAERARVGDALAVVAALTAVLPDDTFLSELTLRGGQVTVSGRSAAAVRLIGLIAADPVFHNPAFTAPVTRPEGGRLDNFSLRADTGGDDARPAR